MWNINVHSYRRLYSTTTALTEVSDQIFTAADDREIATAITIDEYMEFDSIDHSILLRKHETTLAWIKDYLGARTQYVSLGGQQSTMTAAQEGVPQGSILGPILFNICINDLPDICNDFDTCNDSGHLVDNRLFSRNCKKCGVINVFADYTIYVTSNKTREDNQFRLNEMINRLEKYMNNNRLTMNTYKTTLWEFMMKQKLCRTRGEPPKLITLTDKGDIKEVLAQESSKYLGGILQKDLQWKAQIETRDDTILPLLRKKFGVLKYIGTIFQYLDSSCWQMD